MQQEKRGKDFEFFAHCQKRAFVLDGVELRDPESSHVWQLRRGRFQVELAVWVLKLQLSSSRREEER